MCCLFGLIDYQGSLTAKQKNRILRELSIAAEERGTDATGIAYNTEHGLQVYKRPLPARRMHFKVPADAHVVMGHTRMATQGRAKRNENNHPFLGSIGRERFALAHNGVLYNDYSLRRTGHLPETKIETDSYIAVQLIEQQKALDLRFMAEQVEGSFTFTVLTEQDELYFIKGDNPLCLVHFPLTGAYVYASTAEILSTGLLHCGWLGKGEKIGVECGEIVKIDRKGRISRSNFDAGSLYLDHWGCYRYPLYDRPPRTEAQYIQDLKSVAACYGYTSEMIDRLFSHGFTTDEIEELLYESER